MEIKNTYKYSTHRVSMIFFLNIIGEIRSEGFLSHATRKLPSIQPLYHFLYYQHREYRRTLSRLLIATLSRSLSQKANSFQCYLPDFASCLNHDELLREACWIKTFSHSSKTSNHSVGTIDFYPSVLSLVYFRNFIQTK